MTTNPDNFGRRDSVTGIEQYMDATIRTASPARLRLMLIERAVEVAAHLADSWRSKEAPGTNEHSLKLLEIVNELLSGVKGGESDQEKDICQKVADLYVFLAKHLVAAEETSDASSIDEIKAVLEVEAETWRAVCAQETPAQKPTAGTPAGAGGLNLEG